MIKVLDKGYVELLDYMGNDQTITDSARVSYQAGTTKTRDDNKLLKYLYENQHMSPFEMVEFRFRIKLPIYLMRQLVRHRTANINEESGRYSVMRDEFTVPQTFKAQSNKNKQCSGDELNRGLQVTAEGVVESAYYNSYCAYERLLELGVARETARIVLPLGIYTTIIWKMDLRNLLHFIKLRDHPHAQDDMIEYARAILKLIEPIVPEIVKIFNEGRND